MNVLMKIHILQVREFLKRSAFLRQVFVASREVNCIFTYAKFKLCTVWLQMPRKKRFVFAEKDLHILLGNKIPLQTLWFSDEAPSHMNGHNNKQNFLYWGDTNNWENTHEILEKSYTHKNDWLDSHLLKRSIRRIFLAETQLIQNGTVRCFSNMTSHN